MSKVAPNKFSYNLWGFSILLGIISCILTGVSLSVEDLTTFYIGSGINAISFFIGLILWIVLLCFQKTDRNKIHQYGFLGFIVVILIPSIMISIKVDKMNSGKSFEEEIKAN
jgi:uncharacterized membrane protein